MPNIWKRENQLMALDKKIDDTQFGSRLYTFLDWVITEKGIGIKRMNFWNKNSQPANTERVWYAYQMSGVIKKSYPFGPGPLSLFSLLQASATTSVASCWRPSDSTKKRKRGRLDRRTFASRLKAPGLGFRISSSSSLSRYPNPGPHPI